MFDKSIIRGKGAQIGETLLRYNPNLFVNCIISDDKDIYVSGIKEAAKLIKKVSTFSNNGFDNFRVGLSSNCPPNIPFFPYSKHHGGVGFSIAVEALDDLLIECDAKQWEFGSLRASLLNVLTDGLAQIQKVGQQIEQETGVSFLGMDASLAPFPNGTTSVGLLIEKLGADQFGCNGSLFVTSFLTDLIKEATSNFQPNIIGFNGVMFSLLEDDYVAKRNDEKLLTIDTLIMLSALCGCGLDMVPLPGDVTEEEIVSISMDVSAQALKLKKPLGIRVLPIQGKGQNEFTDFNYDFLVDSRVMNIRNRAISRLQNSFEKFKYLKN